MPARVVRALGDPVNCLGHGRAPAHCNGNRLTTLCLCCRVLWMATTSDTRVGAVLMLLREGKTRCEKDRDLRQGSTWGTSSETRIGPSGLGGSY